MSARRYLTDGTSIGAEFRVNTYTSGDQQYSKIASNAQGDFVITWESSGQDGSSGGVYAQRYAGDENVDLGIILSDTVDPVAAGQSINYTAVVDNLHPAVSPSGIAAIDQAIGVASGVTVSITKPSGTTFGSAAGDNWSCVDKSKVKCSFTGVLAPASSSTLTISLNTPPTAGTFKTKVSTNAVQYDSNQANNNDSEKTTVNTASALDR